MTITFFLLLLALATVLVVLVLGLLTMARGTRPDLSQKFMAWRVRAQFAAVALLIVFFMLS